MLYVFLVGESKGSSHEMCSRLFIVPRAYDRFFQDFRHGSFGPDIDDSAAGKMGSNAIDPRYRYAAS